MFQYFSVMYYCKDGFWRLFCKRRISALGHKTCGYIYSTFKKYLVENNITLYIYIFLWFFKLFVISLQMTRLQWKENIMVSLCYVKSDISKICLLPLHYLPTNVKLKGDSFLEYYLNSNKNGKFSKSNSNATENSLNYFYKKMVKNLKFLS